MVARLNAYMLARASGRLVLLWLLIAIGSFVLMAFYITPAFQEVTAGLRPFDLNFGVSAEMVYRDLPSYTDRSRSIYLWFAFADYVYPFSAAVFFSLLWAWLYNKAPIPWLGFLITRGILLFPFLFALIDWLENVGFLIVIFSYPTEYPGIANAAGALKTSKPIVEAVIVALTLVFAVAAIRGNRKKHSPS
jgi:hypothetical protein